MTGLPRTLEKSSRAHLSADSLADLALPAHLPQLLSFAACAAPPHTPGLAAPSQATGSPARAFEVGLTSSHDAATRAHTLTFLREAAALLQDMAALLPWTAALDVHCEAQQSLRGCECGVEEASATLRALSRVVFVAQAYMQRAIRRPDDPAPSAALPLGALLPATSASLVQRLEGLVQQQHACLATVIKYSAEFERRVAALGGGAALQQSGLSSTVALLAELRATRTVCVAMVPCAAARGSAEAGVGFTLQAALAVAPRDPALGLAVAGTVVEDEAAGAAAPAPLADTLVLAISYTGPAPRTLRMLHITLQQLSHAATPEPFFLALNLALQGRAQDKDAQWAPSPPPVVAVFTLPSKAQGIPILSACLVLV